MYSKTNARSKSSRSSGDYFYFVHLPAFPPTNSCRLPQDTVFSHLTCNLRITKYNGQCDVQRQEGEIIDQQIYKDLALNKTRKQTKGGSRPWEHCALCGCYGKNNKSMVLNVSQLLTKTKTFKLNQSLTCADFGIYIATWVICHEQCVATKWSKPHIHQ